MLEMMILMGDATRGQSVHSCMGRQPVGVQQCCSDSPSLIVQVFDDPKKRRVFYIIAGVVGGLFALYLRSYIQHALAAS